MHPPYTVDVLQCLRHELTTWLWGLCNLPIVVQSRTFREFMSTEANLPPPGMTIQYFAHLSEELFDEMDMEDLFAGSHDIEEEEEEERYSYEEDEYTREKSPTTENGEPEEEASMHTMMPIRPSAKTQQLDDFVLLKVIGKGSFGKVLQVRKKDTGAIYAMKVLRKENIIKRNQG